MAVSEEDAILMNSIYKDSRVSPQHTLVIAAAASFRNLTPPLHGTRLSNQYKKILKLLTHFFPT